MAVRISNYSLTIRLGLGTVLLLLAGPAAIAADALDGAVIHHDVSFISHGVTLRGTVYTSRTMPPFAAAVWVDGAGQSRRSSSLARYLAYRGLALLTYDKRGVGASGGVYAGPEVGTNNVSFENLALLADDAAAALRSLTAVPQLHDVPNGYIGASQAGWIIPLAARKTRQAHFMVFWSGAVETTHENVLFEQTALPDNAFWSHHAHDEVQKIMAGVPDHLAWTDFDPRPALSGLSIPGLWIFGGRDRNEDADLSITRLKGLIAAGHSNYSYRLFPSYDHRLGGENTDIIDPSLAWIRKEIANH